MKVTPVNDAPVAQLGTASGDEDTLITGAVKATDVDNASLTYSVVTPTQNGTLIFKADGTYTYQPKANFSGTDSFTYRANDGSADSAPETVTITVKAVNDAPVVDAAKSVTLNEDGILSSVLIGASDPDGDALKYEVKVGAEPKLGSVTFADGKFTYVPKANANGTDTFTVLVSDGHGGSAEQVVTATIKAVDDAPTAEKYTYAIAEDQSFNFDVLPNDKDVDGDTVTLVSAKSSLGASVYVVTNDSGKSVLYYEADAAAYDNLGDGKTATDTITYTVKDSTGLIATSTITVTINGIKDGITIDGGNGEDIKVGTDANETISGFNSNDQLDGKGGADRLIGGNGDDTLKGGDGADKLYGDRGNDTLQGERGNDFLTGGLGEDTFVFDSHVMSGTSYHGGTDTIVDFKIGVDHIKLGAGITVTNVTQMLVASLDDRGNTVTDRVMDTVVTLSNGGQIQLAGINNLSDWHILL